MPVLQHTHPVGRALGLFGLFTSVACAGSGGTATVHIKSVPGAPTAVDETLQLSTKGADGKPMYVASASGPVIDLPFFSSQKSVAVGDQPTMHINLSTRQVTTPSGPTQDSEIWGLGPLNATVYFEPKGGGKITSAQMLIWMDEWRFTGDATSPFHLIGHSQPNGTSFLTYDMKFDIFSDCSSRFRVGTEATCGGQPPPKDIEGKLGPAVGFAACPAELVKPFIGAEAEPSITWSGGKVSVAGAALSFPCVKTLEDTTVACGANQAGLTSAGCTWHASAWAVPENNAGKPYIQLWVGAVTEAGCATPAACNSSFRSR